MESLARGNPHYNTSVYNGLVALFSCKHAPVVQRAAAAAVRRHLPAAALSALRRAFADKLPVRLALARAAFAIAQRKAQQLAYKQ
ncbi:MAG: hypothetical protein HC794_08835, partial [Nitrospiraceae bacterium]|nr:hypothetical protein [Nitrospiraceae bacterium]